MKLSTIEHENKSQGVLYKFKDGPRIWFERQKRFLVIGGELAGRRMTRHEMSESKWFKFYQVYHRVHKGQDEPMIWVYMP